MSNVINVTRTPVSSTNVDSVGYDEATGTMEVRFHNGKVYRATGVPADVAAGIHSAPSAGAYFARNIKGAYDIKPA